MPEPGSPLANDAHAARALRAAIAGLPILVGLALFLMSPWWAKPVAEAIESLPGGKWLTVPLPFVPLLLVLLGAAGWRRDAAGTGGAVPGLRGQRRAARS